MAVYVDDASIPASVRNGSRTHTSTWCHLTADTQEELHAFAAQLGLKRSYFQPGTPIGGKPSPFWHYDLTAGKRAQAVRLGAVEVGYRDMPALMRARETGGPARPAAQDTAPRLLFTSSRDGVAEADVEAALRPLFALGKVLVAGGARGGDQIAAQLWRQWGGQVDERKVSPAGLAAQPRRRVRAQRGDGGRGQGQGQRVRGGDRPVRQPQMWPGRTARLARRRALRGPGRRGRAVRQPRQGTGGHSAPALTARSGPCAQQACSHRSQGSSTTGGLSPTRGSLHRRARATRRSAAQPGHPYTVGCAATRTSRRGPFRPSREVPAAAGGICPCCSKSQLAAGREICQGCGAAAAIQPPPEREFADLSHGQPGHMCVLPGQAELEAEAGS